MVKNGITLVIIGLLLSIPLENAFAFSSSERARLSLKYTLMVILIFISVGVVVDFIKALVRVGRKAPVR